MRICERMKLLEQTQAAILKCQFSKFYSNSQNKNEESIYADGTVLFPLNLLTRLSFMTYHL